MKRSNYAAKQTTHEWKLDQLEYKQACDTYVKYIELQKQLNSMLTIFATVENKINAAIGLRSKDLALVYGYKDDPQLEEAFTHLGATFEVRFKVRVLSNTLVYPITLKIDQVFELTPEALGVNMVNQIQAQIRRW